MVWSRLLQMFSYGKLIDLEILNKCDVFIDSFRYCAHCLSNTGTTRNFNNDLIYPATMDNLLV